MPFVQLCAGFSVYISDLALQSHDWTKGISKCASGGLCCCWLYDLQIWRKLRQTLKIILRHFEGMSTTSLEGLEVCAYIIPGFKLVRHSVSLSFSVNICSFIGTSEAIEVIPSLVGNDTAILLSFKPQIQHKKPKWNTQIETEIVS